MNRRSTTIFAAAVALALLAPAAAQAHALGLENDPNRPALEYLWLGFLHMVTGWDHLLFIGGILLVAAGNLRTAAKLISLFVVGHSLTLLVATIAGWKLNATLVDVIIALSVVFVGIVGLRGRPKDLRLFGAAVFGFGLIHGLGLSTRLQDLGLPDDGLVGRVVLFNVGVEIGQLVALAIILGIGRLVARRLAARSSASRAVFGALIAAGLIAAAIISFPSGGDDGTETKASETTTEQTEAASSCVEQEEQAQPGGLGGGHPAKPFFEPGEPAPSEDLAHVIGDGYVIVRYDPELPTEDVDALRDFVGETQGQFIAAAPADGTPTEPLSAVTALKTLTCEEFDVEGLRSFYDEWMVFVRSRTG